MAVDSKYLQILPDEIFPARERAAWTNRWRRASRSGRRLLMLLKHLLPPLVAFIVFIGGWELIAY